MGMWVQANHVERKVGLGRLEARLRKIVRVGEGAQVMVVVVWVRGDGRRLVGRRKRGRGREVRHRGEVKPPRSQISVWNGRQLQVSREAVVGLRRLFTLGSQVVVKKLYLVVAQGKLQVVSGTRVSSVLAGVADPRYRGSGKGRKQAIIELENVGLEETGDGKRRGRADTGKGPQGAGPEEV